MRRILSVLLTAALCAFLFVGCAKQNEPSGESSAVGTGGTLRLVLSTNDGSTRDDRLPFPWLNRTLPANLMFRSLLIADSTLTSVSPDLAASYTVSEDGLQYVFTLKDGLTWSDGEPLTAADAVFSIETAKKSAVVNSIYTAAFAKISDMAADGQTLSLTLSAPYAAMLSVLAQFAILPQHSLSGADPLTLDAADFWKAPVTSGWYMPDELKTGNYFTLKQNPHYEGQKPQIEKVTVSFVTDFITAAGSNSTDFVYGNAPDLVETMSSMSNFAAYEVDVLFYKYFIFNMKGVDGNENPAMQNIAVRQAVMTAIDRAALLQLYPNAKVLNSGVPNEHPAYNGFSYTYDAAAAKAALAASGYDLTRPLRICYYNNDQTSIDLINAVVYYLQQAGLKAEATLSNDGTTDLFTTRGYDIGFKGKSAFSIDEWYTEYLSGDALFSKIFGGDTDFDEPIARLNAATDESARNRVLAELQTLEQEKLYKVPVLTVGSYVFVKDTVTLPAGTAFCNPLYNCDVGFQNWTVK